MPFALGANSWAASQAKAGHNLGNFWMAAAGVTAAGA
jgi:hypothetical protein